MRKRFLEASSQQLRRIVLIRSALRWAAFLFLAIGVMAPFSRQAKVSTDTNLNRQDPSPSSVQSAGWTSQSSGTANNLFSVHFVTANEGWAVGFSNTILHTSNSGTTWSAQTNQGSVPVSSYLGVRFVNSSTGWAGGGSAVMRTTDGGASWAEQGATQDGRFRNNLFTVSPTVAWIPAQNAVSSARWFSRFTAGVGEQNFNVLSGGSQYFDMYFTDPDNGWAVGTGPIVRISNGSTASPSFSFQTTCPCPTINGVYMFDANTGWVVGNAGLIMKTTNGGGTWTAQSSGTGNNLRSVHFVDVNTGWAVGAAGTIVATTDGGSTWNTEASGVSVELRRVFFVNANVGFAVGAGGTILRRGFAAATLGSYPNTSVQAGANTTITPDSAPTNTVSINVSSASNFRGTFVAAPATGVVTVTGAQPAGTYPVTVTAFNSAGETTTKTFSLTVTDPVHCDFLSFNAASGSPFSVGAAPQSVAVGDFNSDGKQDLVVANDDSHNVTVLLGNGSGGFTEASGSPFGVYFFPASVAVGDFNGDGRLDITTSNYTTSKVTVLLADGSGGFNPASGSPFAVGSGPFSIAVGDFNGDGRLDLATANGFSDNATVLIGDGAGGFSPASGSPFAAGSSPYSVAVGDINSDGKLDLMIANYGSSDVTVLLGNGSGGFSPSSGSPFTTGSGPRFVGVGDFNEDGKPDLAIPNDDSGDLTVLLGNGAGGFSPAPGSPFGAGSRPLSVAVGDLNGDGNLDLSIANFGSNNVTVLLGNGSGGFSPASGSPFAAGMGSFSIAVGDFNQDGKLDLATANRNETRVTVLLNTCTLDTAPAISTVGVTRQQGSPSANATIANVNDAEDPETALTVTVNGSASATVNGVNVSSISVNSSGVVTADVMAGCTATTAVFTLRVTDTVGLFNESTLTVTVDPNTSPALTYPSPQAVIFGGSVNVSPTATGDNGSVSYSVQAGHGLTTAPTVDSNGVVSITNAQPGGPHTVTIRATDNCGAFTDAAFTLNVGASPSFAIDDVTHSEGAAGTTSYTFTVTRTGTTAANATVNFTTMDGTATTADSDYQAQSGTVAFLPADNTKTITVLVRGDTKFESDEAFTVHLSSADGGTISDADGIGTINNDDSVPTFAIDDVTHNEGNAGSTSYTFTVTKTGLTAINAAVNFATMDGSATIADSDYQTLSGTLNFQPADATKTITVIVNGDTKFESDETFSVHLSNPSAATISDSDGTGTIANDDGAPTLAIDDVTHNEGNSGTTSYTFTVTRTGATAFNSTVDFATMNGTATTADSDYQPLSGSLTFLPADTTKQITVLVNGDTTYESDEAFTVHLSDASGATIADADGTGTISNDDSAPSFAIDDVSHNEGNSGTTSYTFTVTKTGGTALNAMVNFTTIDGTATTADNDYQTQSGTLVFLPADTTKQITVLVNGDTKFESDEAFTVHLSGPSNATISDADGTGTIINEDTPPSLAIDDVTHNEGNAATTSFTFTVTKTGSTGLNSSVNFTSVDGTATVANNDYQVLSGTLTFLPAETTKQITVLVNGDTVVEPDEGFTAHLFGASGATISDADGTGSIINDDCSISLSRSTENFSAAGGTGSVTLTTTSACAWTAVSNDSFIMVTGGASGSGNGTTTYSVAANTGIARTGTMTIAGQTFTVTQDSGCTFMLSSTSQNFSAVGGMSSVNVVTSTDCLWTAVSNDGFITIDSGASGSGNGTVSYSVGVNAGPSRMGTLTIAGITFTVTQDSGCTFSLNRDHQSFAGNGGNGQVNVTASDSGCAWTASTSATFIHITSGAAGAGTGPVQYSVDANPGSTIRSDTITIAGHTFTVYQGINFQDVPSNDVFYGVIGQLSARAVTLGCGNGNFCPNNPVTREQMAAFILRAKGEFNPPTPASRRFNDVDPQNVFYNFIDRLAVLQITVGCTPDHLFYCPTDPVRRDQMAAFLLRGLGEFSPPTPASQRFTDVPSANVFYNFIDRMAVLNITLGCTPDHLMYCPNDSVTRAQMAAFLVRAFDL